MSGLLLDFDGGIVAHGGGSATLAARPITCTSCTIDTTQGKFDLVAGEGAKRSGERRPSLEQSEYLEVDLEIKVVAQVGKTLQ
jgi:hypothetical protein